MAKIHSERFVKLVNDAKTRIEEITPKEVKEKQDQNEDFVLLDVREQDEWGKSCIAGARYMGKGVIERDIEQSIPETDTEIVLYCGGGYRSILAADNLQKMGYRDVKSLKGGFRSWTEAGLPIVKSSK